MENPTPPNLHINIFDHTELLVAECVEVPVVVEGKTEQEIVSKMHTAIKGYFTAFPEKKDEIFQRRTITIPTPI